ncbi:hypothetical protein ACN38_g3787 [Penicillium nordicum]|uniref:Uncharacterized protein n=1 Tax=Penicillium nordicum TaxID=229535 RepID=A0A0M8P529_9EURO|nr:hypothetical protein ACN38_g3787 [Penicillium nordicum]
MVEKKEKKKTRRKQRRQAKAKKGDLAEGEMRGRNRYFFISTFYHLYLLSLSIICCIFKEFNLQPGRYTSQSHDANQLKAGFLRFIPLSLPCFN